MAFITVVAAGLTGHCPLVLQPQFAKMVQLIDIFAKPMICLLRELVQWFEDQNIKVTPESIFVDVQGRQSVMP